MYSTKQRRSFPEEKQVQGGDKVKVLSHRASYVDEDRKVTRQDRRYGRNGNHQKPVTRPWAQEKERSEKKEKYYFPATEKFSLSKSPSANIVMRMDRRKT